VSEDLKYSQLQRAVPNVSRETFERLLAFEALFLKWTRSINLASPSTLNDFWLRHVVDSAQIANVHLLQGKWVDIGSGGGLPGIVMAIFLSEAGTEPIHLVESNGKKAAFLRTALNETGAKGIIHTSRIEAASREVSGIHVVTARALASLEAIFGLAEPWLVAGAAGLFHKGREYGREIEEARGGWDFDLIKHTSVAASDSVILEISNLRRRA
jgi:16S rRNA (guanine527-N7)-methyltransferase